MGEKEEISLDDIFNDEVFSLLEEKNKTSGVKTADQRLIDSFEELNAFFDKNGREPNMSSMSEYSLMARLKNIRENEEHKISLKPYDKHNLLGDVQLPKTSIEDILNDDTLGVLDVDSDLSIFEYRHIPKEDERAEADFVAKRKPLKEAEFQPYEKIFQKVHRELKDGKRKLLPFKNVEQHLREKQFYLLGGVLLYLEKVDYGRDNAELKDSTKSRKDGRTRIIFENGTVSNMLYRSLSKSLYNDGKMVSGTYDDYNSELYINSGMVNENDIQTGWIYILKSKSTHPEIIGINDLYKIGFSSMPIDDRIKNAKNEATYLFSDVQKVTAFKIYNRNADKLEQLLHRFFASACLDIDLYNDKGQRATPREWFVVPLEVIHEAIELIMDEKIVGYQYDSKSKIIKEK